MMLYIKTYAVFFLFIYLAECDDTENGCDSSIPEVPNASYEIQTYVRNSGTTLKNATYTCDSGYELVDSRNNVLYCTSEFLWIGDTPICTENECGSMPIVPNASYKISRSSTYIVFFSVKYICDPGYVLEDPKFDRVLCALVRSRIEWSGTTPRCIENRCSFLPTTHNGNYEIQNTSENSVTIGTTATYTCNTGYELENSTDYILECVFDQSEFRLRWKGNTPRCIETQCGVRPGKEGGRGKVVGGRLVTHPWPWMAGLFKVRSGRARLKFVCGGSIIHESFILTAAHCLYRQDRTQRGKEEIIVELDLTDIKEKLISDESYSVYKIITHPNYVFGSIFDYDIAMLQLDRPIKFNPFIRPVCLPTKELPPDSGFYTPGEYVVAIGYGHESVVGLMENPKFKPSEALKEVILPIQSQKRCKRREGYVALLHREAISDRMFCAGEGRGGEDTCQGDSGGPVMQSSLNENGNISWTQVGIVSWGIGCGLSNTFGYYTNVQKLVDWVYTIISP